MQLVIANKNYSSWSMRPWVLMRGLGIPFEEKKLSFLLGLGAGFREAMLPISPAPSTCTSASPTAACGRATCASARVPARCARRCMPASAHCASTAR